MAHGLGMDCRHEFNDPSMGRITDCEQEMSETLQQTDLAISDATAPEPAKLIIRD